MYSTADFKFSLISEEAKMKIIFKVGIFLCAFILLVSCATPKGSTKQEKINDIADMKTETLNRLYRENPGAKSKIKNSAGYAVFSNINTNLFLFSSGNGYGVAIDNATHKKTYMKMNFIGVGPGIGIKDFRAVFVFRNKQVFNDFVETGWEFGGHADAAAKSGEKGAAVGGEMYIENDIEIYQMTESGIALQATIAGTKYRKYRELN
jgi:lipid-binding SYLF domain-containing protein